MNPLTRLFLPLFQRMLVSILVTSITEFLRRLSPARDRNRDKRTPARPARPPSEPPFPDGRDMGA
ncbi:MAG: hypothetical protein ACK5JT_01855 [Hyphomicrobiaceae bacterium]